MLARIALSSLLVLSTGAALAADYKVGDLTISDPWSRALPPNAPAGAAYFTVTNQGQAQDRLVGAASDVAGKAELHTHVKSGEMMRMQKVDAVDIPASGEAIFAPGGNHVMLIGLKRPLKDGEQFPLTLEFEKAGKVQVEVPVRADAQGGMQHHDHAHH